MDKYLELKKAFEAREDKENAIAMSKYMRNMFEFYGLSTPKRKEVFKSGELIEESVIRKIRITANNHPWGENCVLAEFCYDKNDKEKILT